MFSLSLFYQRNALHFFKAFDWFPPHTPTKQGLTLSQTTNFRLFQTQSVSADDNCKLDENGKKFSKWVENTVGKGEIAR